MLILFILGLLLGAVAVVFALQNTVVVTVSFFAWHMSGSLAVVLLLSITAGVLVCLLILLPGSIQNSFKLRGLRKENRKLDEELRKQKELTLFAKHDIPPPDVIEKIEHGAIAEPEV